MPLTTKAFTRTYYDTVFFEFLKILSALEFPVLIKLLVIINS